MNNDNLTILFYESLKVLFIISAPILLSILFMGLIVSVLQTVTQINEQTLSFIPKIIVVFLILLFFGSWMLNIILCYIKYVFKSIVVVIHLLV